MLLATQRRDGSPQLSPVTGGVDVAATLHARDRIVHEWNDAGQVDWLNGAGIDLVHVPYKGAGPASTDLIAGHVNMFFNNLLASAQMISSGQLRALAVTSLKRSPALPGVPALSEILPGFAVTGWYGIIAPAGTPRDIVDKIRNDVAQVLADPKVRDNLAGDGAIPVASTPDEFRGFIAAETEKWAAVIKTAGVTPP